MIIFVSIMVVIAAIGAFFFFRAENLQRELISIKREIKLTKQETKSALESVTLMISRNDEFAKKRLEALKVKFSDNDAILLKLDMINPLIQNYQGIATESLKGKGLMSKAVNKCYVNIDEDAYKNFTLFITNEGDALKRLWLSNEFKGFLSLVEMLLQKQEHYIEKNKE